VAILEFFGVSDSRNVKKGFRPLGDIMNTVIEETTPPPKTHDLNAGLLIKSSAFFRQARITSLGINGIAQLKTKAFKEKVNKAGEAVEQKRKAETAKLTEADKNKVEAEEASAEDSIVSNLVAFNQKLRKVRLGSLSVLGDAKNRFVEDAISRGEKKRAEKNPKQKGSNKTKASSKSKTSDEKRTDKNSRLVNAFNKVQYFRLGSYELIKENTESLVDEAKENGKAVDFELRRKSEINRRQRRFRREKLIASLGMVSHSDWEQLNQRFSLLALEIENQVKAENDESPSLERRKQERRSNLSTINYDLRVFSRREGDRQVA